LGEEITFAVTTSDFDRILSNGQQPGYLIAAAIKRPEKAQAALQSYWQKQASRGVELGFEQFAGVNLIYGNRDRLALREDPDLEPPSALTTAIVGDRFVLFANYPKVMRDALNNLQVPELSLGNSEAYQQALQGLSTPRVGSVFMHLPQLTTWLGEPTGKELPIASTGATFDHLVMAIQLEAQGVIGETLVLAAADRSIAPPRPDVSAPVQALQYLPATSTLAASGKNLPQLWAQLKSGLEGYDALKALLFKPLNRLQQQWQVEPENLFGWAQGEYALGRLSTRAGTSADWIFVTERSPTAATAISQLDAMAQARGMSVSSFTVAGQSVTAWTQLSTTAASPQRTGQPPSLAVQATVSGVHTSIGNYELFATSLDAMAAGLQTVSDSEDSLLNSDAFQQSIAPLPVPNGGYFYADAVLLRSWAEQKFAARPSPLRPFLEAVRSIAISRYGSRANAARGVVFLRLSSL
jgi:hypothetical protein